MSIILKKKVNRLKSNQRMKRFERVLGQRKWFIQIWLIFKNWQIQIRGKTTFCSWHSKHPKSKIQFFQILNPKILRFEVFWELKFFAPKSKWFKKKCFWGLWILKSTVLKFLSQNLYICTPKSKCFKLGTPNAFPGICFWQA